MAKFFFGKALFSSLVGHIFIIYYNLSCTYIILIICIYTVYIYTVCIYVYMYICIYDYICIYIYVLYIYTHIYTHIRPHIYNVINPLYHHLTYLGLAHRWSLQIRDARHVSERWRSRAKEERTNGRWFWRQGCGNFEWIIIVGEFIGDFFWTFHGGSWNFSYNPLNGKHTLL